MFLSIEKIERKRKKVSIKRISQFERQVSYLKKNGQTRKEGSRVS